MKLAIRYAALGLVFFALGACKEPAVDGGPNLDGDQDVEPPRWHFVEAEHGLANATLTGVWGRSDGVVFAVGWFGEIITNRRGSGNAAGGWVRMNSPTFENLTSIFGVENGAVFGLPAADGEMFAVGWNGTILHFHPNPDDNPATDDGAWGIITAPEGARMAAVRKVDPSCPDYDGDGIADDGDASGWGGDAYCSGGNDLLCDDNCPRSANGIDRPLLDVNIDGCIGPPDDAADPARSQNDFDADAVGTACDDPLEQMQAVPPSFDAPLFDIWAEATGNDLTVVAVGGGGSIVSFKGPSAGAPAALPPALDVPNVTAPGAWIAQRQVAYHYDDDCYNTGAAAGLPCNGSSRPPPSCPAMCNPIKTDCDCLPENYQCCDAAASTGAACSSGTCPAAANACQADGRCDAFCPNCFRRQARTLRSVWGAGGFMMVVGETGTMLVASTSDVEFPTGVWRHPFCTSPPPKPLDERPKLTGVSGSGRGFFVVGQAGAIFGVNPASAPCGISSVPDAPGAFVTSYFAIDGAGGFGVGDGGLLISVSSTGIDRIDTTLEPGGEVLDENLTDLWVTTSATGDQRIWMIGASGKMVQGDWF